MASTKNDRRRKSAKATQTGARIRRPGRATTSDRTTGGEREAARAMRDSEPELAGVTEEALLALGDVPRESDALEEAGLPEGGQGALAGGGGRSAVLSGGDVDASEVEAGTGEEAVGGSTPTPDQDNVDEIGRALGVTYEDNEPLRGEEKVRERDDDRWELDPASAEDYGERRNFQHALPEKRRGRRR